MIFFFFFQGILSFVDRKWKVNYHCSLIGQLFNTPERCLKVNQLY